MAITSILNTLPASPAGGDKVRDLIYWSTPLRCLKSLVERIDQPHNNLCSMNALQRARLRLNGFLQGRQDCYNDSEEEDLFDDALSATYDPTSSTFDPSTVDSGEAMPCSVTFGPSYEEDDDTPTYDPSTSSYNVVTSTSDSAPFSPVDDFSTIIDTDSLRYNPVMRFVVWLCVPLA